MMQNREALLRGYFAAPHDGFWRWQDGGESIAWRDGKTIVFAQELRAILSRLRPNGLPRLGALLLLIAATRRNWAEDGSEVGLLCGMLESLCPHDDPDSATRRDLLESVLAGLHQVHALDSSLRRSLDSKLAIAELVFDGEQSVVASEEARIVVEAIRPGLVAFLEPAPDVESMGCGPVLLLRDLAALKPGLPRITPETVRLRIETGLDELPSPAELELEPEDLLPCETARGLINELLDTAEFSGLAKLAKQLLASTTLPRKLTESHEQEVGGVSDIANRGTPDRLLLSELAHDGLTLAIRVAMNEALYLHHETPPSNPRIQREVLIDAGVRSWGIPRVFATATALALAATTPRNTYLRIWRGSGDGIEEINLTTKEGLIAHLGTLEADPHLADAMPEFARRLSETEDAVEVVLIMPEDSLTEPTLARSLSGLPADPVFVVTVGRTGEFRLRERRTRGEKLVRQAQIDVDQLFEQPTRLVEKVDFDHLPAFFRVSPCSLLLPYAVDSQNTWSVGNWGALSITGDGRLMRWTARGKGAEQLSDQIPKGKLWWISPRCTQGVTNFVFGPAEKPRWFHVDLARGEVESTLLRCGLVSGVTYHQGALFCLAHQNRSVRMVDVQSGEIVCELTIPTALTWVRDRFYVGSHSTWHALSHNGSSATIDALPDFGAKKAPISCVWEADGFEGPVAISRDGKLYCHETPLPSLPKSRRAITDCQVDWISPDGMCVFGRFNRTANLPYSGFRLRLDTNPSFEATMPIRGGFTDPRIQALVRPSPIRKSFRAIGVTVAGELALVSSKGHHVGITIRQGLPLFCHLESRGELQFRRIFTACQIDEFRYKLSQAAWPDGSQAVLDSRGLLHLRSASRDVPEVTLVLAEGELTGWSSDGQCFGKGYFLRDLDHYVKRTANHRELCNETIGKFVEGICA